MCFYLGNFGMKIKRLSWILVLCVFVLSDLAFSVSVPNPVVPDTSWIATSGEWSTGANWDNGEPNIADIASFGHPSDSNANIFNIFLTQAAEGASKVYMSVNTAHDVNFVMSSGDLTAIGGASVLGLANQFLP